MSVELILHGMKKSLKISENLLGGIEHFVYFCKQKLYLFPQPEN